MKEPLDSPRKGVAKTDSIPARTLSYDTTPPKRRIVDRRKPERYALFLADMSRRLFESLDYKETLDSIARLAMPELGAWCIVDVLDDAGQIQRLAIIHPEPSLGALAHELELRYPPRATDLMGAPRIVETQQPELVAEVTDEMLGKAAYDDRQLNILRSLGMTSYMVVPLKARGRLLGSITFISANPAVRYAPKDLLFAEDLAGRAAIAMDNARLYKEAQKAREESLEAEARATLADRAKTDFLATMSHELRTPLNAIAGYAELLELGMRGPVSNQQREAIARIRRSQQHLLGIVNDILTFAKTETGRIPIHLEPTAVRAAIDSAHFLVEPMFEACEIDFQIELDDRELSVIADRERLQQILVNLLSNAGKFSERGGPVRVTAEPRDHLVAIMVTDKGKGIEKSLQETIFEPFMQISAGLTRTAEGSGLGLAIGRELARLMGGDVTVESEPGAGSTFTLTLPLSPVGMPVQ
ncbi:MAG TPA: GAF domain-containing sensor histidine kinase [Gemmatimonadaceae bacterium]|nr:GAF domain-containing sensor histidine kinase [Gemmatimonadaceae bacterium]